ncbi:MAG: lipopolysaccharide kinase InaA family protein [Planctomycetota bacterium]|jgi:hypothetical protein
MTHARENSYWVNPDYEAMVRAGGFDTLDALFDVVDAESLTKPGLDSWRERLRIRLTFADRPVVLYLKRFTDPPPRALRDVRRSRDRAHSMAGLEWFWMNRLAELGVPTITPLAWGESLDQGRERRSAILTLAVAGESLETWCSSGRGGLDLASYKAVLSHTAGIVARLHGAGIFHRDLYLSHLFFDATRPIGEAVHLIDLQRMIAPSSGRRRWMIKDLAALNYSTPFTIASNAARIRWLKQYLGISKLHADARRLVYRVVGRSAGMARHDIRRHRRNRA